GVALGASLPLAIFFVAIIMMMRASSQGASLNVQSKDLGAILKGIFIVISVGMTPWLGLAGAGAGARAALGGQGGFHADSFIGGLAVLPFSLTIALMGIVGPANFEVVGIVAVAAGCFCVLFLFNGYTKIDKLTEGIASALTPAAILLALWFFKIISTSIAGNMFSNRYF
ncbi:MAG: hypothetical protein AB7K24_30640, partial [Gemmataceae bacterium]